MRRTVVSEIYEAVREEEEESGDGYRERRDARWQWQWPGRWQMADTRVALRRGRARHAPFTYSTDNLSIHLHYTDLSILPPQTQLQHEQPPTLRPSSTTVAISEEI